MLFDPRENDLKMLWTRTEKFIFIALWIVIILALLFVSYSIQAHSQWISWVPSAQCDPTFSDDPARCLITGFRIEKQNGTEWIGTVVPATQRQLFYDNLSSGQHFWRGVQLSAHAESTPSTIISVIFRDSVAPQPPTIPRVTVETNAYRVTTNFVTFLFERGSLSGIVKLGIPCDARTTGNGYHYVPKKYITAIPGISRPDYSVVKCSN